MTPASSTTGCCSALKAPCPRPSCISSGPGCAAGSCRRPAAASCGWACRSAWSTTAPGTSCSTPTPACSRRSGTCSRSSPAPARPAPWWPPSPTSKLLFPVRISTGPRKGELAWMPLTHWRVLRTLHNPRYAGAFVYGRRRGIISANGKNSLQPLPRDQWTALIPGAHPGYITWETYEANQQILLGNAAARGADRAAGPAREGTALLQGLAICGRCGRRMTVRYHARGGTEVPDYQCMREAIDNAGPRCQAIPGAAVDAAIGQLLLETLTPLTLEVALTVQAEIEARAAEADAMRAQPRRARPPPRRPGPPPLPGRRPRQPAGRRQPGSRLERRAARPASRPGRLRQRRRRHRRAHRGTTRPASGRWPPTSPPCGPTRPPRSASASAWPGCSSTTSP